MRLLAISVLAPVLFLASCTKQETPAAGAPQATVMMRDGTQIAGSVVSSSPTEIKVAGADSVTRTIPMSQVRSIDYGEPVPAASTPPPPAPGSPPPPSQSSSMPKRIPRAESPHIEHSRPVESEITSKTLELPAGTELSVRTEETIDSSKAAEGQTFAADVTKDVLDANGDVVIPRGSNAQIVIRSATKGGRITGASDLVLDLQSVSIDGRQYQISTTDMSRRGSSGLGANKRTAEYTGGGAALGAIIGAIAGGGKGAASGAASGAGAGAVTQIITKGGSIKVPSETVLTFKLDRPLRVVARR